MIEEEQKLMRFHAHKPEYHVDLPFAQGSRSSALAFSHNKAGSSMFYNILRDLCDDVGLTFVTIPGTLFRAGVEVRTVNVDAELSETGHLYGGFRHFPDFEIKMLDTARTVLLVRDPRDVLVSHYYSTQDSHPLPTPDSALRTNMLADRASAKSKSIDRWVVDNHGAVMRNLEGYLAQRFLRRPNVAIYRYEDVVFRKRDWIRDLVAWYGWEIAEARVEAVAAKADVFPSRADPMKHIRQVTPGNYRTALKPATQNLLTNQFRQLLNLFDYETTLAPERRLFSWRR
jgi:hypothetical protein